MAAWNGWRHCVAGTYGSWLPGDPRGFRTRRHREHVDGDYRNPPPPGKYERRYEEAKERMRRSAVVLTNAARSIAVKAVVGALRFHGVEVIAVSVGGMHVHLLARFPVSPKPTFSKRGLPGRTSAIDDPVRHLMGIAKKESAKALTMAGLQPPGGVWARRGKIVPIRDRRRQVNVFRYILAHQGQGAAVWSFRDPAPEGL